jgi:hypothetical protein
MSATSGMSGQNSMLGGKSQRGSALQLEEEKVGSRDILPEI